MRTARLGNGAVERAFSHHLVAPPTQPKWRTTVFGVNVTTQPPRSGVVWSGVSSVRVRPWPHLPHQAFLLIAGSHGPDLELPNSDILNEWVHTISSWGYQKVRTTALAPAPALALREVGFVTAQDLILMKCTHYTAPSFDIARDIAPHVARRFLGKRYSARLIGEILEVDQLAFGDEWSLDNEALREAFRATRSSRLLVSRTHGRIDGFVLVGATGTTGFIQRLAVHPTARRTGVASRLVASALRWSFKKGCSATVVNTEITNAAAIGLYRSFDFEPMEHGLHVLEKDLL